MPRPLVATLAVLAIGCLPSFAPNLRAKGAHAGLDQRSPSARCMDCHVSEAEAVHASGPTAAPIVGDWMLDEQRSCVECHRVHPGSDRSR